MEELIPIFFFLSVAAVMILRPLTKRLGMVLEMMARDRQTVRTDDTELARIRVLLEHLGKRMELMEERVDFTERLVASSRRPHTDMVQPPQREPFRYQEREAGFLAR